MIVSKTNDETRENHNKKTGTVFDDALRERVKTILGIPKAGRDLLNHMDSLENRYAEDVANEQERRKGILTYHGYDIDINQILVLVKTCKSIWVMAQHHVKGTLSAFPHIAACNRWKQITIDPDVLSFVGERIVNDKILDMDDDKRFQIVCWTDISTRLFLSSLMHSDDFLACVLEWPRIAKIKGCNDYDDYMKYGILTPRKEPAKEKIERCDLDELRYRLETDTYYKKIFFENYISIEWQYYDILSDEGIEGFLYDEDMITFERVKEMVLKIPCIKEKVSELTAYLAEKEKAMNLRFEQDNNQKERWEAVKKNLLEEIEQAAQPEVITDISKMIEVCENDENAMRFYERYISEIVFEKGSVFYDRKQERNDKIWADLGDPVYWFRDLEWLLLKYFCTFYPEIHLYVKGVFETAGKAGLFNTV